MCLQRQSVVGTRSDGTTVKVEVTVTGDDHESELERSALVATVLGQLACKRKHEQQYQTMVSVVDTLED